jgi:DNA-directed RNA polymerase subunit RPC12/RpoP
MSNRKFVCFDCRVAVRRNANTTKAVLCPNCGKETVNIGYKIPIPPKTKVSEWQALREQIHLQITESVMNQHRNRAAEIHALEKEIEKMASLPSNTGRESLLKELKKRLASYNA